ncbi:Calcium/calmodulin-dependent/calcium-dependent protein kinase [Phytophthora cactorum]|nr:Calcium/calmodulin-dependent/calcium-dependent protein kinase [Phytophthora cactorum]
MPVIHDRYRLTLYGWVFACEDMCDRLEPAPPSAANVPVVIKQVSLERMATFMRDHHQTATYQTTPSSRGDRLVRGASDALPRNGTLRRWRHVRLFEPPDNRPCPVYERPERTVSSCSGSGLPSPARLAHRDVSLENIMLHRGRCKLGDFGLARVFNVQAVGVTHDPKAADVWSLGIVLFIMLTGSPLVSFASMSVKSFRALKQAGIATVLEAWGVADAMPSSALQLVSGMLEIDPHKRLTIEQVLDHDAFNECLG